MAILDTDYAGARFYKCDLHLHTPLDQHWREDWTRLKGSDTESRRLEVARHYLQACHNAELEVIGVTDHNFSTSAEQSFVRHLRAVNQEVVTSLGRSPVIILPGFEIEADVGKGCHVICLFDS